MLGAAEPTRVLSHVPTPLLQQPEETRRWEGKEATLKSYVHRTKAF